jgi:tetratricopeptide (TPR) repeat protein
VEDEGIELVAKANSLVKAGDPVSLKSAAEAFKQAIQTFHGMNGGKQTRNEGISYYGLARAYHALKQNEQAIDAEKHALPLLSAMHTGTDLADAYNNMGVYCVLLNRLDEAGDAYSHAEQLYEAAGKQDSAKSAITEQGEIDFDRATAAARKKDWPTARDLYVTSTQLFHKSGRADDEADAYHKLSLIYSAMGIPSKAEEARNQERAIRVVSSK